ncbi:MAG: hypothetical protein A2268_15380 [Candidatus Raymondbacteria bacterium RifOxyA12_full_50_37]|uniref:ATP-grasp domain-containing protein n=1 Tax=Candidatus Raymondbacteria bacterium RIFOXYD12_FULL_49_13 TaxID=1817890 RepID=A0A1F7F6S2_UNCRA|nr:MAG: hypothetical protein A2268_15380 [Candidatus Raymondbacteria bacterium RifOxyA12_full_50_37]OGJ88465.1 MAG: hypothetical protein A2248_19885 [Candidatus Raymondbacteria bacterium RIFOXYA2_FULL_49_16]OGJ96447.1 MAG: hypothetical protein A2350_15850 [Candidatus Raymondbacteria bacterium RifOxyB12_full_50_8]OGJ98925.1 MAG: hypothetical protein A2453_10600 [Candidatus Raymondbacteria bacterium RIFOXYC2_FULL_50_21]OGK02375.1 MAG: hypothetical protein A2519_16020 [Candidatus Raymondbacteria b
MSQKKILILGGGRYNLKVIHSARNLGYYTIVADRDEHAPGFAYADEKQVIDITDYLAMFSYARHQRIDGIAAINDYGVFTAAYVAEKLRLPGIECELARIATDKGLLRKAWEAAKQPNPRFRIVFSLQECRDACREIGLPVILKPTMSMGGNRGVMAVREEKDIQEAYAFASAAYAKTDVLVEECLKGIEHSVEVIIYNGRGHVIAMGDNSKQAWPYRVNTEIVYPTELTGARRARLEQTARECVESLGWRNGCAHVECCTLDNGEVKLFELGARPGGGGIPDPIVPFFTGVNEFEEYLRIIVGEAPHQTVPLHEKGCVYHFLFTRPGKIKAIHGLEEVRSWKNILDAEVFVKPGDAIPAIRTGPDRPGFVIAGGETRQEAIELGRKAGHTIVFEYEERYEHQTV